MAASKDDLFMEVGNPGTATTLSAPGYTVGNTTITVGSTTNWATNTGVCFSIYETEVQGNETVMVAGTYNEYFGTVASATGLANVEHVTGSGTDRNYSAGATTVVTILYSAGRENRLVEGLLVSHDQDGTLKADSVDVTAVIKDAVITNAKLVNDTVEIGKLHEKTSEYLSDFIYSGGVVAQSAGLVGTFTDIVYYIAGVRYTATSVANKTYTASKDTYVDIGTDGTVDYNEVSNGAASPALSASHIRVAKVVTNGSAITSAVQTGTDSLSNLIKPKIQKNSVIRQDDATNSTVTNAIVVSGWGWKLGENDISVTEAVTFPVTFASAPIVVASLAGYKASSDPASVGELTGDFNIQSVSCGVKSITTTGFTVTITSDTGTTMGNTLRVGYTWIAIGAVV